MESSIMKQLRRERNLNGKKFLLELLFFYALHVASSEECPAKCMCTKVRTRPTAEFKLKCGTEEDKISSLQQLNLENLPVDVYHLDLSDNNITYLPEAAFVSLPVLQKLNLSRNLIQTIEIEAFSNLTSLKRLDLNGNRLKVVTPSMFVGLENLEKLVLGQNLITKIREGTFDELVSLKQLDLSANPLLCDCELGWLLEWARNVSVKLTSSPKCGSPVALRGQLLRKLQIGVDFQCNSVGHIAGTLLELKPAHNQVVFEGDSLRLRCRAPSVGAPITEKSKASVTWMWGSEDPVNIFEQIRIENRYLAESGLVESSLSIEHLDRMHSGKWNCHLVSEEANQTQTISVIVISEDTEYCPQTVTSNNKGMYTWPKTVVGYTVELHCVGEQLTGMGSRQPMRAQYTCTEAGSWEFLNTSVCPFVSETTKILEQFAKVNLSVAKGSVLESAKRLKNFTSNGKQLRDKMDVVFISKTIENYLEYITKERELGSLLVDIVSSTLMHLPKELLMAAQVEDRACSRLVRAVEVVAEFTPSMQSHKSNLAVEEFRVNRESFKGLACTWYTHSGKNSAGRLFHCSTSTSNSTASLRTKVIEASIHVPPSLFYQLEVLQGRPMLSSLQLVVSMYENNRLFPRILPDGRDIVSCVIGTKLVGVEVENLTHPVFIMLRAPLLHDSAGSPKPVWWDSSLNNGSGGWSTMGCQLSQLQHGLLVFQCNRLGYFGLMQKDIYLYDHLGRVAGAKFRFSHPAIYVGSIVGVLSLLVPIVTYIMCHASIQMSKKTKHSLVNTWIALALLCFMYSLGIHQTEVIKICQGVGLVLHYLTLSALLWMAVTASNMYKRLTKSDSLDTAPEDELPPEQPVAQKPLLGLYLVGWGIALIVCGISGAVNMRDYAGYSHCFLTPGPALSAVFIPVGMLVSFLLVFYLLIRCSIQNLDTNGQLSEGTQATENVDLDLLDSNITNTTTAERTSLRSASTPTASSDVEDPEHSPLSQLKAHVIVLMLYLLMWTSAAITTAKPFKNHFPYEEIIFSVLYGLLASCLGIFVTFFYCIARSDVRAQWHLMECWCKRRRGRCCRTRSISDTNPTLPTSQPLAPITNVGPRAGNAIAVSSSNSVNSSGHTAKSHNSSVTKAAVELNGTVKRDVDVGRKISNVNLVVLHRQQYRSNNSVTTFTEASGASGAEMFYNPHQSTVARKFFRKQRRHLKHNNLGTRRRGDGGGGNSDAGSNARAESAVFLSSDMENASSTIMPCIYSPSSKVNNTNVHVERPHRSSRCRDAKSQNPNILTDSGGDDAGKCHDLPLERLVIGAEETNVSASNTKDGPPLGSDSESHEVRSKPIGVPDEGIGETIGDCANNVRTESNLVNNETEDCCETDRVRKCLNTSTSNMVCCENKNKSDSIEKQDHDNVAENEQNNKDDLGKVLVLGQKSELLLKGKKLSLPSNEMNEINEDDVPAPNKKETSV